MSKTNLTDPKTAPKPTLTDELKASPEDKRTEAMKVAIAQKWTLIDGKVDDLRKQLATEQAVEVPTVADIEKDLLAQNPNAPAIEIQVEAKRLQRNAKVNRWRKTTRLQASIDTRALRFASLQKAGAAAAKTKKASAA